MKLEFKQYKMREDSRMWQAISKSNNLNEFIVVGEKDNYYKVQQFYEDSIHIIGGLKLDECALLVSKDDLYVDGDGVCFSCVEINIPSDNLTMELIENIQRLND